MVRTIDVHNHLFPKEWIDYLEKGISHREWKEQGME